MTRFIAVFVFLSSLAFSQSDATSPANGLAFDVADVHVSPRVTAPNMRGGVIRAGRFEARNATMVDLISRAYGIDGDKVVGGPSWLEIDRYDVIAKAPASTSQDAAKLMLRNVLANRFKLVVQDQTKAMPAFVLSLGKGKPKLKESAGGGLSGCDPVPQPRTPGVPGYNVVACHNMTAAALGQTLHDFAGAYVTNPVVDKTGLEGTWDFELKWTGRGALPAAGAAGITLFDAVDKQLGLKLEPQNVPQPVLRVVSANEKPNENAPGVTTSLPPPPPAEFEVADIKPTAPDFTGQRGRVQNGRVDLSGMSLKTMIQIAWELNGDELLAGAPKFLDEGRWDVVAKAPIEVANQQQADIPTLELMLQALLAERFKLKTHMEDRPVNAYTLTGNKPKMAKADPSNRTSCKDGQPGPDGKDPRIANPILNRLISCYNMTMAQFVEQIPLLANGYAHTAVLDQTGLTDAYDFTLSFSGIGLVLGGGAPGGPGANAEPNGAVSLPDAVGKQMGLKLELVKRPVPVLVIDHVEEKPTEN